MKDLIGGPSGRYANILDGVDFSDDDDDIEVVVFDGEGHFIGVDEGGENIMLGDGDNLGEEEEEDIEEESSQSQSDESNSDYDHDQESSGPASSSEDEGNAPSYFDFNQAEDSLGFTDLERNQEQNKENNGEGPSQPAGSAGPGSSASASTANPVLLGEGSQPAVDLDLEEVQGGESVEESVNGENMPNLGTQESGSLESSPVITSKQNPGVKVPRILVNDEEDEKEEEDFDEPDLGRPNADENNSDRSLNETPSDDRTPTMLASEFKTPDCLREYASPACRIGNRSLVDCEPPEENSQGSPGSKRKREDDDSDSDNEQPIRKYCFGLKYSESNSLLSSPFHRFRSDRRLLEVDSPSKGGDQTANSGSASPFYSNPMATEADLDEEMNDACRGDRIGNTSYAERHVIKILMKWMQKLEPSSSAKGAPGSKTTLVPDKSVEDSELPEIDEELLILWDLSSENDVIDYLVEKDIFSLIKATLVSSNSSRLMEIALGILANLLSFKKVLDNFQIVDAELDLISLVLLEIHTTTNSQILVQAFAVLERITWYINAIKPNISWIISILTLEFVNAVNFILKSSLNVILLGKIITTLLPLFNRLSRTSVFGSDGEEVADDGEDLDDPDALDCRMTQNFDIFSETCFVPSLCEALNELIKHPLDSEKRDHNAAQKYDDFLLSEIPIPPDHIQTALCSGIDCLGYFQKFKAGQLVLKNQWAGVMTFLKEYLDGFHVYTEKDSMEAALSTFATALNLMSFCHRGAPSLEKSAVTKVLLASQRFSKRQKQIESSCEYDVHKLNSTVGEHIVELEQKFGFNEVRSCYRDDKRLTKFKNFVKREHSNLIDQKRNEETNSENHYSSNSEPDKPGPGPDKPKAII